jgi:glycine/D-amino acid oxidase-like deaminating enzyme
MAELDAELLVIGGGFYGSMIAASAAEQGHRVTLIEREADICLRASYRNQARVHNGYHYPRSFTTGWRSHANYKRFIRDFVGCVRQDFTALYAIARTGSLTSARQFKRFCKLIDSPLRPARPEYRALFSRHAVEEVFEVEEGVIDADALRTVLVERLARSEVQVQLSTAVTAINTAGQKQLMAKLSNGTVVRARRLLNCTYGAASGINGFCARNGLKHEVAEVAIARVPDELHNVGFTIMDGPFGSVLPFPALGGHSMTHVRYTPHGEWFETELFHPDPSRVLKDCSPHSRFPAMVRDLSRFVPAVGKTTHLTSLFEVKTVCAQHEVDDARPILFTKSENVPGAASVLGSKIDNIYDALEELDDFLA